MFFLCCLVRPPLVEQVCTTRPFPFKVSWLIGCKLGAMVGILLPTSRPLLYRNAVNALRCVRSLLLIFCCKALPVEEKENERYSRHTNTDEIVHRCLFHSREEVMVRNRFHGSFHEESSGGVAQRNFLKKN
ncbi:Hypothetical protein, putative [Bodo saltans]|uniref:Uncharacterized protein n=1 Tax=Bodo saltans TaxID=75058 RepID=A0A0S4IZH4_BODSA|nr:Hypothetical protein, putative [Bodo saltans]|eukprot:CUG22780.1 Hypothetical protein, putative [Bodo saltans]